MPTIGPVTPERIVFDGQVTQGFEIGATLGLILRMLPEGVGERSRVR